MCLSCLPLMSRPISACLNEPALSVALQQLDLAALRQLRQLLLVQAGWRFSTCQQALPSGDAVRAASLRLYLSAELRPAPEAAAVVEKGATLSQAAKPSVHAGTGHGARAVSNGGGGGGGGKGGGHLRMSAAFYQAVCLQVDLCSGTSSPNGVPADRHAAEVPEISAAKWLHFFTGPMSASILPGLPKVLCTGARYTCLPYCAFLCLCTLCHVHQAQGRDACGLAGFVAQIKTDKQASAFTFAHWPWGPQLPCLLPH